MGFNNCTHFIKTPLNLHASTTPSKQNSCVTVWAATRSSGVRATATPARALRVPK
jgi:hypothetical protein